MSLRRALIVTVGTGTRPDVYIVKPLVKTIRDSRPDFLVLVVTEASRTYGDDIIRNLGLDEQAHTVVTCNDFDDFQAVFRDVNKVFRDLANRGYRPDEIQVDFTSGTKAMSSGAVLSAIHNQCRSIKYITGSRQKGIVVDGAETFLTVSPSGVFALYQVRLAEELIKRLRFSTADEILKDLKFNLLDSEERSRARKLRGVGQAYWAWDLFDHRGAVKKIGAIQWDRPYLSLFEPAQSAKLLLESLAGDKGTSREDLLLLDLFNNAVRRALEGRYDDAVARLYRATEFFAQVLLGRDPYRIRTDNVDLGRFSVSESFRKTLEQNRDEQDGQIRIGLVLDYKLLAELGHYVGRQFMSDIPLQARLQERNNTILAHGMKSASKKLYERLKSSVEGLFELGFPGFGKRAKEVQFPWLEAEN